MSHDTPAVTISAHTGSRWRCGVEHGLAPVAYEAGRWSADELERLRADPMLVVVEGDATRALDGVTAPETIAEALGMALLALREAEPGEVRAFCRRMSGDPEIRGKIEEEEVDRQARLIAAIDGLDPKNPEHWNADGETPSIKALEAATGLDDIAAAERDAALEAQRKAEAARRS